MVLLVVSQLWARVVVAAAYVVEEFKRGGFFCGLGGVAGKRSLGASYVEVWTF